MSSRVVTTEGSWHNGLQYVQLLSTGARGAMLEDLDLHSIADEQARELVRRLLNLLEDVRADLRVAQAEIQRLRNEINRLKGEQGQPTIKPNTPPPPPRTSPRNGNGAPRKRGRKAVRRTVFPSTGNRSYRSLQTACRRMPSSRGTRRWWCRTSSSVPTMSCSIKRSFTPHRSIRRIWRLCPKATMDNSARGSRVWRWCSTMGRR